jgi:plasmid stabilization system protein ParE
MRQARALLQQFPEAGNTQHGLQVAGFRTLVAGKYLIDYRLTDSAIEIATIRHGRMQIAMPELDDPDPS